MGIGISGVLTYFNGAVSFLAITMVGKLPLPLNIIVCYGNALIASLGILALCSLIKYEIKGTRTLAMSLLSILGLQEMFFVTWLKVSGGNADILLNVIISIVIMFFCYNLHKLLAQYLPWSVGINKKKK